MSEKLVSFFVGGLITARRESISYSCVWWKAGQRPAALMPIRVICRRWRCRRVRCWGFMKQWAGWMLKPRFNLQFRLFRTPPGSRPVWAQTPMHMCCNTQNKSIIDSSWLFLYILEFSNLLSSFVQLIWSTQFCQNQFYSRWSTTGKLNPIEK